MFILIAGGGKLGYYLAKALIHAEQEVALIEKDRERVEHITDELGSVVVRGDACDPEVLTQAGAERADLIAAVTGDDEDNLVICQVAKSKFHVSFTIARVNNPSNEEIFKKLGIDAPVSSTSIILAMIEDEIAHRGVMTSLLIFRKGGIEIVETRINRESPVRDKSLREITLPTGCTVAMVMRGSEVIIPDGNTRLMEDDTVLALAKIERFGDLKEILMGHPG